MYNPIELSCFNNSNSQKFWLGISSSDLMWQKAPHSYIVNGLDWEDAAAAVCSHKCSTVKVTVSTVRWYWRDEGREATCWRTLARSMRGDKWGQGATSGQDQWRQNRHSELWCAWALWGRQRRALFVAIPTTSTPSFGWVARASSFSRASLPSSACCCAGVRINKKFFDLLPLVWRVVTRLGFSVNFTQSISLSSAGRSKRRSKTGEYCFEYVKGSTTISNPSPKEGKLLSSLSSFSRPLQEH